MNKFLLFIIIISLTITFSCKQKTAIKKYYSSNSNKILSEREIVSKEDSTLHGKAIWYSTNGKIRIKGNYRTNKKHGKWRFYDFDGSLSREKVYENGILINDMKR